MTIQVCNHSTVGGKDGITGLAGRQLIARLVRRPCLKEIWAIAGIDALHDLLATVFTCIGVCTCMHMHKHHTHK